MTRFVCIHGHFYQPPREDPWWEEIAEQPTAAPYQDWNERITAECYGPNAWARILHHSGSIDQIVNNYSRISFNFGPTLLSWLEQHQPKVYAAILEADLDSRERFSGHGSAIAQTFNHMILPLANRRDKETQIRWGLEDFQRRFGRQPEGMWLAETAVDTETLDLMAQAGIRYTILAPSQARAIRAIGSDDWHDVSHGRIDPTRPYEVRLPSGNRMAVFFYDGPISRAVAFERLLENGERLVHRLMSAFAAHRDWDPLVHISTDGETYGHHHARGEMALAYALENLEHDPSVRLTNYGEYLAEHPPQHVVEIWENSSWSCVHGVQRWCADCGCNSGLNPGFHQGWRGPYRAALDWLRDLLSVEFEDAARRFLWDPWGARNRYVDVVLDRSAAAREEFLDRESARGLDENEQTQVWRLLEMQRQAMLMYTSCGWFFDELSGIETVQTMRYAARAMELSQELFGTDHETDFLNRLEAASSNLPEYRSGRHVYLREVDACRSRVEDLVAEYAVRRCLGAPLLKQHGRTAYEFAELDCQFVGDPEYLQAGGRLRVTSRFTRHRQVFDWAAVVTPDHRICCQVEAVEQTRAGDNSRSGESRARQAAGDGKDSEAGERITSQVHALAARFSTGQARLGVATEAIWRESIWTEVDFAPSLQREFAGCLLDRHWQQHGDSYRALVEQQRPLIEQLQLRGVDPPASFLGLAEEVLSRELQRTVARPDFSQQRVVQLLEEARFLGVALRSGAARPALEYRLAEQTLSWLRNLDDTAGLQELLVLMGSVVEDLPEVSLTEVQNLLERLKREAAVTVSLEQQLRRIASDVDRLSEQVGLWWPELRSAGEVLGSAETMTRMGEYAE